jgi:hypothetical protein
VINVADIVEDPDLASSFTIQRTTGSFQIGGWQKNAPTFIQALGDVRNTGGKELDMLPEADRPKNALSFRTTFPLYVTTEMDYLMSDILIFHGEHYRVLTTRDYSEQGYFFAIGERMEGN